MNYCVRYFTTIIILNRAIEMLAPINISKHHDVRPWPATHDHLTSPGRRVPLCWWDMTPVLPHNVFGQQNLKFI